VGPGGPLGGLHWGTATDGDRVYVEVNNGSGTGFTVLGNGDQAGMTSTTGMWAALDSATGDVIWEIMDPALDKPISGAAVDGPTVVVNGVVFAGSMDKMGTMFAIDAATGEVLWSFESGGTVYGGPAVANGVVYWGCGYPSSRLGFGTSCKKVYAFEVGP
jgi:polyvinyl alcohol dehydrogenase (cytochrome)